MSENIEKNDTIISNEEINVNSEHKEIKAELLQSNEEVNVQKIETKVEINKEKIDEKESKEENESKKEGESKIKNEEEKKEESKEKEKEYKDNDMKNKDEKKEEIKIEEKNIDKNSKNKEIKNEMKGEPKKDENDEIKIIKKKKTLKQSDSELPKENEEKKENINENIDVQKKEKTSEKELKPSEKNKFPNIIHNTRTRYTFRSDNKNLNNIENPQKNIINEKKNHQIFISIVPITSKKENIQPNSHINQPKNLSKLLNLINKNDIHSEQNKLFNKNIRNENNKKVSYTNIKKKYDSKKLEISKPIELNNNINIRKPNERDTSPKLKNNVSIDISNQKTKNLKENKPPKNLKEQINKENTTKIISTNITNRRITTNYLTNPNQSLKNEIKKIENKYVNKKIDLPPTTDTIDKKNKKIYTNIKIDISKYNTEKKPINTMNRLFDYNSRTLDTRKKETKKLKYYDRCPNCGYKLNDS